MTITYPESKRKKEGIKIFLKHELKIQNYIL